ncbi:MULTISPECIES: phospholipase D family protein [unclassified Rhodococcus (in: high G+C Gram-positive bacteria)]|uniref:phospholipase D family protein n=1 Tax=unclassified Rhodococcus (in: high G+C Gram-positive bacteria) TaxID=192944 RepID=UPI001FF75DB2|nr:MULTISPECIES: phospholipase D family protein [unclassified Rhodococcus (in: high G+C Gram-positive bacteria)]
MSHSAAADSADPLEIIAAVQASIHKVDIFHQRGMIAVPPHRSRLHTLLEPALHAVQLSSNFLFHPKIWVVRFEDQSTGQVTTRLIVMSRNLARGRSWDVALTLDGEIGGAPRAQNKPIVDLLRYLTSAVRPSLSQERADRISALAEEIRRARWTLPTGATDLDFHVFGVPGPRSPKPDFSGYKHLLISPFLTDDGLAKIAEYSSGPVSVVSRQESLNSLSAEFAEWITDPFVLSPTAGIPADDAESSGSPALSGLHAKLYCVERARKAHLFIGSANATRNAFRGNVEILVELTGKTGVLGVDALLGKGGFMSILQSTTIEPSGEEAEDQQAILDGQLRQLVSAVSLRAELSETDEAYTLHLTSEAAVSTKQEVTLMVSLLTDKAIAANVLTGSRIDVPFEGLTLSDVTAFVVLTISDNGGRTSSTVVKADLVNDVPGRMSSIVTREISTPDAFRRFLALLLAFGAPSAASDGGDDGGDVALTSGRWDALENGLFEQLLRVSTSNLQILNHLAGVVESIIDQDDPNGVLPEGFRQLWSAISTATKAEVTVDV